MFGLNGRNFWKNIIGHWAVHYQRDPERIWGRVDISKTIDIIQKSKAEIIGIVEVLEGQEKELKRGLREKGYNFFYLGKGHKTKYSELYVQELVASKIKGKQKETEEWPVEHRLGGGGGFVHVHYPRQQFHLLLAHLGLRSRKYHLKQIDFLQNYTRKLEGRVVILGDFNLSYQSLKPHFLGFDLVSEFRPYFSTDYRFDWGAPDCCFAVKMPVFSTSVTPFEKTSELFPDWFPAAIFCLFPAIDPMHFSRLSFAAYLRYGLLPVGILAGLTFPFPGRERPFLSPADVFWQNYREATD